MNYKQTISFLKENIGDFSAEIALITGTGLSFISEISEIIHELDYKQIPGFMNSSAPLHEGKMIFAKINHVPIIILNGRFHLYEGYSAQEVTFPIRILKLLGIRTLIQTNASGSLKKEIKPGEILLIEDHINFMGTNPLIGENDNDFGPRFPSMHNPYDISLRKTIIKIAKNNKLKIHLGNYIAVKGPSLETKAECLMFQKFGADVIGMSTVPETITAIHCGIKVIGLSVVSNYSNIFHDQAHSIEKIKKNTLKANNNLVKIITNFINLQK